MLQHTHPETPEYKRKELYLEAGADYVITNLAELKSLIRMMDSGLEFHKTKPRKKTADFVNYPPFL